MDAARKRGLLERRATAWEAMKTLMDLAAAENRDLTGDEVATYNKHEADITAAEEQITVIERAEERERKMQTRPVPVLPNGDPDPNETEEQRTARLQLQELRQYLRGDIPLAAVQHLRALQADSDTEGGYLITPQTVAAILLEGVRDQVFVRRYAHVEQVEGAASLGIVSLDTDLGDADWTAELTPTTDDSALRLGKRELKPNYLTKEARLSRALVRRTRGGAERLVMDRLRYKFGITEEKGFLTGSGANQPLGAFTASAQGVSTARDVSTDNTTTAITADGLIEAKHFLKGQYWPRARWTFHRDAVKNIRKLKDGNGQYLWQPSVGTGGNLQGGIPGTILDLPYDMSEYAPNTFTTGLYVGLLCDWEFYWIADAFGLEIQVLNELYARSNQYGYIGRRELDGMPVLEEAFVRVKLA